MSEPEEQSPYLTPEGISKFDERERFNRGLETGESRPEQLWNEGHARTVYVKSLGHMNPQQFKEQFQPMNFGWEYAERDDMLHRNVDYKLDELVESVKQHGIVRPVIVGHPRVFPEMKIEGTNKLKPGTTPLKAEILDGMHRVEAASRAGVDIPVNILDEVHQQSYERATYNLAARPKQKRKKKS